MKDSDNKSSWKRIYWFTFALGIGFILALYLFTYYFNNPV